MGKGVAAGEEGYDGVIAIGPFNCLPFRISEAILKPYGLRKGMPILTYESDGFSVQPGLPPQGGRPRPAGARQPPRPWIVQALAAASRAGRQASGRRTLHLDPLAGPAGGVGGLHDGDGVQDGGQVVGQFLIAHLAEDRRDEAIDGHRLAGWGGERRGLHLRRRRT